MIFYRDQNWRTTNLPFSLALKNTVNTGVSFNTPSNAVANSQRWASAGFQGLGQYGGKRSQWFHGGLAGMGCGCGCGQAPGGGLVPLALAVLAGYLLTRRSGGGGYEWSA